VTAPAAFVIYIAPATTAGTTGPPVPRHCPNPEAARRAAEAALIAGRAVTYGDDLRSVLAGRIERAARLAERGAACPGPSTTAKPNGC
jgi:hypothetical protein